MACNTLDGMNECDMPKISISIVARAFASIRDIETDLCDVNTFLNAPDFATIGAPAKLPPHYRSEFLLTYARRHTFYEPKVTTPLTDHKWAMNCGRNYDARDLVTPTTISRRVLIDEWGRSSKAGFFWKGMTCEQNGSEQTRFALFADRLIFLNVVRRRPSLIASVKTRADIFGVEKITADDPTGGQTSQRALVPSTKVRYRITNRIQKEELTRALSAPTTPIGNISHFIGGYSCALEGPDLYRPHPLRHAINELATIFLRDVLRNGPRHPGGRLNVLGA